MQERWSKQGDGALRHFEAGSLRGCDGLIHGFFTRADGRPGRTGYLGLAARELCLDPAQLVIVHQVHGATVLVVDQRPRTSGEHSGVRADAIISRVPLVGIGVLTADCLPIVLFDPANRAVGIVHAGWRGTSLRVSAAAVSAMGAAFGSRPEELVACLGPAIGPCCYEVSRDVAERLARAIPGPQAFCIRTGRGKYLVDLMGANRADLMDAGVREGNLSSIPLCTSCRQDLFHSHRGSGGRPGRQVSIVAIRG